MLLVKGQVPLVSVHGALTLEITSYQHHNEGRLRQGSPMVLNLGGNFHKHQEICMGLSVSLEIGHQ